MTDEENIALLQDGVGQYGVFDPDAFYTKSLMTEEDALRTVILGDTPFSAKQRFPHNSGAVELARRMGYQISPKETYRGGLLHTSPPVGFSKAQLVAETTKQVYALVDSPEGEQLLDLAKAMFHELAEAIAERDTDLVEMREVRLRNFFKQLGRAVTPEYDWLKNDQHFQLYTLELIGRYVISTLHYR